MDDFVMASFNGVKSLDTSEEEEILFNEVLKGLSSDDELGREFKEFLVDPDKIKRVVLPLYQIIQDRKPCKDCKGFFACPKKDWKGYKLGFDPRDFESTKHFRCEHLEKQESYVRLFDFTSYNPYTVLKLFSKMFKDVVPYKKTPENGISSSFVIAAIRSWKKIVSVKDGVTKRGYNFTSPNDNRLALAFFVASISVYLGLHTSIINVDLINKYFLERNVEGLNSLLDDIKNSDVYVVTNLDRTSKQATYVDSYLLPILRLADNDSKILFTSSSVGLDEVLNTWGSAGRSLQELFSRRIDNRDIIDDKLYTL